MAKLSFLTAQGYMCNSVVGVKAEAKKLILQLVPDNAWTGRVLVHRVNGGSITPDHNHQPVFPLEKGKTRTLSSFKLL